MSSKEKVLYKSWIPEDRPVCGKDLMTLRERHGLTLTQMESLAGFSCRDAWYAAVKAEDEPVDRSLAIWMRVLAEFPEFIDGPPEPERTIALRNNLGMDYEEFGQLLGRKASSCRQWEEFSDNKRYSMPSPPVAKLIDTLEQSLEMGRKRTQATRYSGFDLQKCIKRVAKLEWKLRGETSKNEAAEAKRKTKRTTKLRGSQRASATRAKGMVTKV